MKKVICTKFYCIFSRNLKENIQPPKVNWQLLSLVRLACVNITLWVSSEHYQPYLYQRHYKDFG